MGFNIYPETKNGNTDDVVRKYTGVTTAGRVVQLLMDGTVKDMPASNFVNNTTQKVLGVSVLTDAQYAKMTAIDENRIAIVYQRSTTPFETFLVVVKYNPDNTITVGNHLQISESTSTAYSNWNGLNVKCFDSTRVVVSFTDKLSDQTYYGIRAQMVNVTDVTSTKVGSVTTVHQPTTDDALFHSLEYVNGKMVVGYDYNVDTMAYLCTLAYDSNGYLTVTVGASLSSIGSLIGVKRLRYNTFIVYGTNSAGGTGTSMKLYYMRLNDNGTLTTLSSVNHADAAVNSMNAAVIDKDKFLLLSGNTCYMATINLLNQVTIASTPTATVGLSNSNYSMGFVTTFGNQALFAYTYSSPINSKLWANSVTWNADGTLSTSNGSTMTTGTQTGHGASCGMSESRHAYLYCNSSNQYKIAIAEGLYGRAVGIAQDDQGTVMMRGTSKANVNLKAGTAYDYDAEGVLVSTSGTGIGVAISSSELSIPNHILK